ncbi:MAG: 2'-5' RNA ligase family protein [Actinomycetota bacterium]|nr:2'-5' RNA ligase family protein [Actinomycetota bacterium]
MARRRAGVALVLDPPVADEVDGLRRALGAGDLARMPPHVTLVRPVNLRAEHLWAALERLRSAGSQLGGPLHLTLGPPAAFPPEGCPAAPTSVLYLQVGGDLAQLRRLHEAVAGEPLDPPVLREWVPHVTLLDGCPVDRARSAIELLGSYAALAELDRVVLLEERTVPPVGTSGARRRWFPVADVVLGERPVVGRGGLEVAFSRGRILGPDLVGLVEAAAGPGRGGLAEAVLGGPQAGGPRAGAPAWPARHGGFPPPVVVTATRRAETIGGAAAWWAGGTPQAAVLVAPDRRGEGVGRHLLARLESDLRDCGWSAPRIEGVGPARFYAACSSWVAGGADPAVEAIP